MAKTAGEASATRADYLATVRCSPRVHTFYGVQEQAEAVARAKSRDGLFFVARRCAACSGWRLRRLS